MSCKKFFSGKPFFLSFHLYIPVMLWCLGFFLGAVVGRFAEPAAVSLMLRALPVPMSIDGLLTSYYFPLLLWTVVAQTKHTSILSACCFIFAFVLAYLFSCVAFSVSLSWVLLLLFFSPAFCNGVLLLWLSVRSRIEIKDMPFFLPVMLMTLIAALDYFIFSPIVSSIIM